MGSTPRLAFWTLAIFFVVFPATVQKPGMPMVLRSDEPAYYLMALSLAHDGDLRCDLHDLQRLRWEFPYTIAANLILMTDDGWKTAYFGKPFPISLLAAPFVRLFGADGMVTVNMLLLFCGIWMGWRFLSRFNPSGRALLASSCFFLFSNLFVYVFWLHTEVLTAIALTASLFWGLDEPKGPLVPAGRGSKRKCLRQLQPAPFGSAAALVVAAYHKPILAAFCLPVLLRQLSRRNLWGSLSWLAGATVAALALAALGLFWTGQVTPYLGVERQGFRIERFDQLPFEPRSAEETARLTPEDAQRNSWWWLLRMPEIDERFLPNLLYFFVGRHTGLFVYAPFALVALVLFLFSKSRTREQWSLLASVGITVLFFLTLIPFNWHGGGGFVGNRYFVNAYPALLFLVTRVPGWAAPAGAALAGVFVGPILLAPYGPVVPQPSLQWHARNRPFDFLPYEETLAQQVPGYVGLLGAGTWTTARRDVAVPVDNEFWIAGGKPVQLRLRTHEPLRRAVFELVTVALPNEVELRVGDARALVEFPRPSPPQQLARITLSPRPPTPMRPLGMEEPVFEYSIRVRARDQELREIAIVPRPPVDPLWAGDRPSPESDWANLRIKLEELPEPFAVGVSLAYLGEEDDLAADVYGLDWRSRTIPSELRANRRVRLPARVRNTSGHTWPALGPTRVALSYHWRHEDGALAVWEGARTLLRREVRPGEEIDIFLEVTTPSEPGNYLLELDAVRERLSWFSERNPALLVRVPVRIVSFSD